MPKEIEDYVHQIGRTGRSGKTGIATTFVNMNTQEQTLLDLKYLLMEAKQRCVSLLLLLLLLFLCHPSRSLTPFFLPLSCEANFVYDSPSTFLFLFPSLPPTAR
jgi:hypothetical protein